MKPEAMESTRGCYNTFVVKIWCDETKGTMRGHIQHVSSQEYIHFANLANMNSFILDHLGSAPGDLITLDATVSKSVVLANDSGGISESS